MCYIIIAILSLSHVRERNGLIKNRVNHVGSSVIHRGSHTKQKGWRRAEVVEPRKRLLGRQEHVHFNGNWTHISSDGNHPDHLNGEAKGVSSGADRMFLKNGQVENSSNNFVNYGENTGIYEEIVGTVTAAFRDLVGNQYHAFAKNQHYILNHENKTVISTETYG